MNLNGDEKRIEQLFRELRREDEPRTPSIQSVLNRKTGTIWERGWSIALAGGLAILLVAMVITMLALGRTSKPQSADDERTDASPPAEEVAPSPKTKDKPSTPKPVIAIKHRRPRRTPDTLTIAIRSLSSWQSPTASLLSFPGEDMLKTLPRLDESLETIKSLSTDQYN